MDELAIHHSCLHEPEGKLQVNQKFANLPASTMKRHQNASDAQCISITRAGPDGGGGVPASHEQMCAGAASSNSFDGTLLAYLCQGR